jgi:hypothetical protein
LHVPKHRGTRRRLTFLLLIFSPPRSPELRFAGRVRAHLAHPLLASARSTESRERACVGARFEREVEQLKHVRINRVD